MSGHVRAGARCGLGAGPNGEPCQREVNHLGRCAPYAAEAVRLDLIERNDYMRDRGGIGDGFLADPLVMGVVAAARAADPFIQHNPQCNPLLAGGCACGVWALQAAVREFEERYT